MCDIEVHLDRLRLSLELANKCIALGDPPFSALLVRQYKVEAVGVNATVSKHDPLRHAEIEVLREYFRNCFSERHIRQIGRDVVMYCSTEPCLMCMGALYWAGIKKVIYGGSQKDLRRMRGYGVYLTASEIMRKFPRLELIGPLLPKEAEAQWGKYYLPHAT